jgi:hypothetical protein
MYWHNAEPVDTIMTKLIKQDYHDRNKDNNYEYTPSKYAGKESGMHTTISDNCIQMHI